jgi:type III secretory pathway component EscS
MDKSLAKKLGSRQAFKGIIIGLIIAYLIMAWFSQGFGLTYALLWIKNINYKFNLLIGVIAFVLAGHFLGEQAGIDILIKRKNKYLTGVKYGFFIVIVATIMGSLVGVFQNAGIDEEVFFDYLVKPLFWVILFGFIPIIIVGIWFGSSIESHSNRNTTAGNIGFM